MKNHDTGKVMNVLKDPVLTLSDFSGAKVSKEKGQTLVAMSLKETSSEKIRTYSAAHIGEQLAMVFDGELLRAPVIRDTIQKDFVVGPMSDLGAKQLVEAVNGQK